MNTLKKIIPVFIAFSLMALVLFAQNALFVNSATGNVGVGTDDPESNLHVVGSSGDVTTIEATDSASSANLVIKNDTTSWTIQVSGSNLKILDNNDTTRVTISSTGNVTLVNNLTANALTASNATISGTVTANTITPTTVSGNVNFTGNAIFNSKITPSMGITMTHKTELSSTTKNAIYDDMEANLPLNVNILAKGSISYRSEQMAPDEGGAICYVRKVTGEIRLYYIKTLDGAMHYFEATDGGGAFGYNGYNIVLVMW